MRSRWLIAAAGRSRLRIFALLVLSVSLAGYGGYRYWQYQEHQQAQRAEYQEAQAFLRRLEQPVKLQFGKSATIQASLDEWSRQTGIPVSSVTHSLHGWSDPGAPVASELPPVSAQAGLQALADLHDLRWNIVDHERIEIHLNARHDSLCPREAVRHSIPANLVGTSNKELSDLIQRNVTPARWHDLRDAEIVGVHDQLVVVQTHDVQLRVAEFLNTLQLAVERAAALPRSRAAPDDPRLQPILLSNGAEQADWLAQFDEPVTLDLVAALLPEFAEQLSAQTGIPLQVDRQQLEDHGRQVGYPITIQAKQVRLRTALAAGLEANDFSYRPLAGAGLLQISDEGFDLKFSRLCCVAYPAADLIPADAAGRKKLVEQLKWTVSPDSWQQNHHWSGGCELQVYRDLLIARVPLRIHWELHDMLTAIRRVRSGPGKMRVTAGFDSSAAQKLLVDYEQQAALSYRDAPLWDVVADLRQRFRLPIAVIKDRDVNLDGRVTCDLPVRSLRENLDVLFQPHNLRMAPIPEYLLLTSTEDAECRRFVTEVVDVRHFPPGIHDTIRYVMEIAAQRDTWGDRGGPGTMTELNGLLVIRHQPAVIDQACAMLQFLENDLLTRKPIWPDKGELRGDELNRPLVALTEHHPLIEANYEKPVWGVYYVGDLLREGRNSESDLVREIGNIAFDAPATIHLHCILEVELSPRDHERLQAMLRILRQESAP